MTDLPEIAKTALKAFLPEGYQVTLRHGLVDMVDLSIHHHVTLTLDQVGEGSKHATVSMMAAKSDKMMRTMVRELRDSADKLEERLS